MRAWPCPAFLILALASANAWAEPPVAAAPSASPAPPAAASDKADDGAPTLAYVALGLGGAALLTGGVFGIMALGDRAELKRDCPDDTCTRDRQTDVDAYESKKLISGIGLISGGAFAALGAILYFAGSDGDSEKSARLGLWWGGEQGGVYGAF